MTQAIGYHAHVYYDATSKPAAARLRETIASNFTVKLGGFSDEPRGPHPISQFNVIFQPDEFSNIVPWLMLNRQGLDVLVHPLTDDMVDDHSIYAMWLGTPVTLKLDTMKGRDYSEALLPAEPARTDA